MWIGPDMRITEVRKAPFFDKDKGGYNMTGLYIIDPSCINLLFRTNYGDFFHEVARRKIAFGYLGKGRSININTGGDLDKARKLFRP